MQQLRKFLKRLKKAPTSADSASLKKALPLQMNPAPNAQASNFQHQESSYNSLPGEFPPQPSASDQPFPSAEAQQGKAVGIDLGTTKSVIAVMQGGQPVVLLNAENDCFTPSVVAFREGKDVLVGLPAKRQAVVNPDQTILSVKRSLGLPRLSIGTMKVSPVIISSLILKKLKKDAETRLNEKVSQAVITVPAYFNERQRQFTQDAGIRAGFNVLRIISEPTAAALAYGFNNQEKDTLIAVYHLGGGTFDISILEMGDGVFQVKSTNGDTHLGGDDFDGKIIDYLAEGFQKAHGIDPRQDRNAFLRLWEAAEQAKCKLSAEQQVEIDLPYLMTCKKSACHLQTTLTRSQLEQMTMDLVERTLFPCQRALEDAGFEASAIHTVLLVGGQARMPLVQEKVKDFFNRIPIIRIHPDDAVAKGAAITAGILMGEINDRLLLDVNPLTLSVETMGGVATPLITRNTTIPTRKSQVFSTAADNQTSVEIKICQGERPMVSDNILLGHFLLEGIPPAPHGVPQIEVSFDIDGNGILNVSAKDKATGKAQQITIKRKP